MIEKEGWAEEETTEMKGGIDSGWEEGIISHRGSVQWGSIIHCICATCSDQCDDRNLREENSQQHHWSSTRGSLQLMKRAALLFKTGSGSSVRSSQWLLKGWTETRAAQGEHNHHLDNHLQLCNVFHFKSTQWFVGRRRGRWVSSTSFHAVTLWTYGIWATKHGGDYILQYSLPHVHIIHPRDVNYGTSLCFFPASIIKT